MLSAKVTLIWVIHEVGFGGVVVVVVVVVEDSFRVVVCGVGVVDGLGAMISGAGIAVSLLVC